MITRTFTTRGRIDLALTLAPLRHGRDDPTIRLSRAEALRAARTPEGPATLHLKARGSEIAASAWGPGASWILERAPLLVGAEDDVARFDPRHTVVRRLHRHMAGLRICRSGTLIDTLVPTILEQKITTREAHRSFRSIVRIYGEPAPGPGNLRLQPAPEKLAALPYWAFHPLGVAETRAQTIRRVCKLAPSLERTADLAPDDAAARLRTFPGVGPWTVAHVLGAAFGDADAVIVGDFHLPHAVTWVLAGEPRGDDERMLELLAQFEGHRGRVMRLIAASGSRPPQTTPRRRIHHIAHH